MFDVNRPCRVVSYSACTAASCSGVAPYSENGMISYRRRSGWSCRPGGPADPRPGSRGLEMLGGADPGQHEELRELMLPPQ
jgi:hypothetical protein